MMADTTNTTGVVGTGAEPAFDLKITDPTQLQSVIFTQDPENPANLLATLPGGETQTFADYLVLTQVGLPPALTLTDGSVIPGEEIIALVDEINYDLLAPAAGPTGPNGAGGGAGFTPYGTGALGDQLLHGPYGPDPGGLPEFDRPDYELHLAAANTNGTVVVEVIDSASGYVGAGYEDGQPNQHIGDYSTSAMKIVVTMAPGNVDTERVDLTLSGIPDGSELYVGGTTPGDLVTVTGGTYVVNLQGLTDAEQLALLDSIYLIGPKDSDVDFTLYAEARFSGPSGELIVPVEALVVLDAVAEAAVISPPIEEDFIYNYSEDNEDGEPIFGIGFSTETTDSDGSEDISRVILNPHDVGFAASDDPTAVNMLIDGQLITEGAVVQVRAGFFDGSTGLVDAVAGFDGEGTLTLTFDPADQVQNVDLTEGGEYAGLQVRLPQHSDMDLSIDATVITREAVTDPTQEITFDNNESAKTVTLMLDIEAVADKPTDVTITLAAGSEMNEDTTGALIASATFGDHIDGSELHELYVQNLHPELNLGTLTADQGSGWTLIDDSSHTYDGYWMYTVATEDYGVGGSVSIDGLNFTPPAESYDDVDLTVYAVAYDHDDGNSTPTDEATTKGSGHIQVDSVPDLPDSEPGIVDETDMEPTVSTSGVITVDFGQVYADEGTDWIGATVKGSDLFSAQDHNGIDVTADLKSGGAAVSVYFNTADGSYTGYTGTTAPDSLDYSAESTIFTLIFTGDGGTPGTYGYSFELIKPLDHYDPTDPDEDVTFNFGIVAVDADAEPDLDTGTLSILVGDDAPMILPAPEGSHFNFENEVELGRGGGKWGLFNPTYNDWTVEKGNIEIQDGAVLPGTDGSRIIELDAHGGSTTNAVVTTVIDTGAEGYNGLVVDFSYSPRAHGRTDTGDTSAFKIYLIDASADASAWEPDGTGGWQPTAGTLVYGEYINPGSDTVGWQSLSFGAAVPDGVTEMKLVLVGAGIDDSYGALLDNISVNPGNVIEEDPSQPLLINVLEMVDLGADGFGALMLVDGSDNRVTSLSLPEGEAVITTNDEGEAVISFMPSLNYNGSLTLDYEVTDFDGDPVQGQAYVVVTPVNDPPVADDVLTVAESHFGGEMLMLADTDFRGIEEMLPNGTLYYKVFDVDNFVDDGLFEASSLGGADIEDPLHELTFNARTLPDEGTLYRYNSTDGLVELGIGDAFRSTDEVIWTLNESQIRYTEGEEIVGIPGDWGDITFTPMPNGEVTYTSEGVGINDLKTTGRPADWDGDDAKYGDDELLWQQIDDGVEKLYIDIPDSISASVSFEWLAPDEEVNINFHYEHGSSHTITVYGTSGVDTQSFTAPDGKIIVGIQVWSGTNDSEFIVSEVAYTVDEGEMELPETVAFTYDVTDSEGATSEPATAEIIIESDEVSSNDNDYLIGDDGDDDLAGGLGNDYLVGGAGDDELAGDEGDDLLVGGEGDDTLNGGVGSDNLYGEEGADTFIYTAGQVGHDTLHDFMPGEGDVINLDVLFDSLNIDTADRGVEATLDSGNTILKVGTYDGDGVFTDATSGTFSITLDGVELSDLDLDELIGSGHIISDES
ncbi:MAG: type I secretion C-terminal target domain-containing protein [Candidatus Sedimenticola sp. (ex Thyasira tokunagai)]